MEAFTLPRCPVCSSELPEDIVQRMQTEPVHCPKHYCGVQLKMSAMHHPKAMTFRLANHYSMCVLPFFFTEDPKLVCERLQQSPRWKLQVFSFDNAADIDRMEYFLPYIRRFLFPGAAAAGKIPEHLAGNEDTCRRWSFDLSQFPLTQPSPPGGEGWVRGRKDRLYFDFACTDARKSQTFSWRMRLDDIKLMVFSYRVGFLILDVRCTEQDDTVFDQMNALNYLRLFAPLYQGFEMPTLTIGENSFRVPQLLAWLLAELKGQPAPASPAQVALPVSMPVRPTYDDRMMVYTFSCLDKETCVPEPLRNQKLLHRTTVVNFSESDEPALSAEPGEDPNRMWLRTRFQGFSKEGTCLVVFDTDRYHERFLGEYHATYYFDIFLMATLQRVTLLALYERLSNLSALTTGGQHSRKGLRRVRRDLLLFKNQCCFSQITNRERGLVLWRRWQTVFENSTLLSEVNDQSGELDSYLQNRMRERMEWLLRVGGFLTAAVPAVLGLNVLLPAETWGDWVNTARWTLLVLLIIGAGLFATFLFFRRDD